MAEAAEVRTLADDPAGLVAAGPDAGRFVVDETVVPSFTPLTEDSLVEVDLTSLFSVFLALLSDFCSPALTSPVLPSETPPLTSADFSAFFSNPLT